jgi:7-cyano-7-deazaguanine synthase in queuosine biosynthesis
MNEFSLRELAVDVVEHGGRRRKGAVGCRIGRNISFDLDALDSFSSRKWQPIVYDALLVAAVVEFCDRSLSRGAKNWGRRFVVSMPVHNPEKWSEKSVARSLIDALNLLTGDDWEFEFRSRKLPAQSPRQERFEFPPNAEAVMAFSDGMDSHAVAELEARRLGNKLIRVRVGNRQRDISKEERKKFPFTALPYDIKLDSKRNAESSARSRGFKFSMVSGLAAYLIDAQSVIVPESGQGALAPVFLPVAHAYEDYRSYPLFTKKMERLIYALLGYEIRYEFPRLWYTKGETLREYAQHFGEHSRWKETRSCWQQSRQVGVLGTRRQCGICAACILRRLSVHAAGLNEDPDIYVWESLKASTWTEGSAPEFERQTRSMREYAIAGVLHFEHLSELPNSVQYELIKQRRINELARSLSIPSLEVEQKLDRLLQQHAAEWSAFTNELGSGSFVRQWIDAS